MKMSGVCLKVKMPEWLWPKVAQRVIKELVASRLWMNIPSDPMAPVKIDNSFFGINIAPSNDPRCDDYTLERLQELKIKNVRMDFSYQSFNSDAERLLQRLIDLQYRVFLNVFPPIDEAKNIARKASSAQHWREFLALVFSRYHQQVAVFEIGNTPNRSRWSGFNYQGFLHAWDIACEESRSFDLTLAGPNVSDFEPIYNIAFLSAMKNSIRSPDIHTDNLFVERVIEPEAYDHRVLGRWLKNPLSLNLIKKARVLKQIGQRFDVDQFICTYNCWTTKRLQRKASDAEQKKADYLIRYLILAAASGAMTRVYWGPLISNRDGLIGCGADDYPDIDNVSFYKEVIGNVDDFQIKPAFNALKNLISKLEKSSCSQGVSANNGINHFVFENENQELHVLWCRDGQSELLSSIYPQLAATKEKVPREQSGNELVLPDISPEDNLSIDTGNLGSGTATDSTYNDSIANGINSNTNKLSTVEIVNSLGEKLNFIPTVISEQPLFILLPSEKNDLRPSVDAIKSVVANGNIMMSVAGQQSVPVNLESWRGAVILKDTMDITTVSESLLPENILGRQVNRVLRDTRNKLWTVNETPVESGSDMNSVSPNNDDGSQLTIKLNRAKGIKKFTYRFTNSKGKRHWDNASHMLRCGVKTPEPVAYFERYRNSGIEENYYICRYVENAFSARDVFTAVNKGDDSYRGLSKDQWFSQLTGFICSMHNQRIIHGDLSSGNLMLAMNDLGVVELYMIDIGRAKIGLKERLSTRQRFIDLMRIAYKLNWADRELFIKHYYRCSGMSVPLWWRLPLYFYESKQTIKKSIKKKLKSRK